MPVLCYPTAEDLRHLAAWLDAHPKTISTVEMPFETYKDALRAAGLDEAEIERRGEAMLLGADPAMYKTPKPFVFDAPASDVARALCDELGFSVWHTGGSCRAVGLAFERHEIYVTNGDLAQPSDDEPCAIGLYIDPEMNEEPLEWIECAASECLEKVRDLMKRHGLAAQVAP